MPKNPLQDSCNRFQVAVTCNFVLLYFLGHHLMTLERSIGRPIKNRINFFERKVLSLESTTRFFFFLPFLFLEEGIKFVSGKKTIVNSKAITEILPNTHPTWKWMLSRMYGNYKSPNHTPCSFDCLRLSAERGAGDNCAEKVGCRGTTQLWQEKETSI
jgi:hypothetical protein